MKTRLQTDEKVVREDGANHQRGRETVGGKLYLTTQRLVFESHAFNIQTGTTTIALQDVAGVEPTWTKFLDLIPIMPNSIKIATREGKEHSFVVPARDKWIRILSGESTKSR